MKELTSKQRKKRKHGFRSRMSTKKDKELKIAKKEKNFQFNE